MKDVRDRRDDDDRENGANGDGKGKKHSIPRNKEGHLLILSTAAMDSPIPAHDDLDIAE